MKEWWESRGFDSDLQKRFLLGAADEKTATIPFWRRGRIIGVVRRKLEGEPRYILPRSEDLPGGHKPLFVLGGTEEEVFLVEGYVDALALAVVGKGAIAVGGTGISEEHLAELLNLGKKKIYILPDHDEEGAAAAATWATKLYPVSRICPTDYGEGRKDFADLFAEVAVEEAIEHLNRLVGASRDDVLDIGMELAAAVEDVRERLAYATEKIVPLLSPLEPEGYRDATTDIVSETVKLKKSWLNKAIKDHRQKMFGEELQRQMAEAEKEAERQREEYQARVAEAQGEIDELLAPGVLERLRDTAAKMHSVYGDREPLELALLVALGAQLASLPSGRPLGASILLTASAGRGKNHIIDAAVKPLPEEFYFAFEIASGQSLYYKADEDPDFPRHTFAYPNEIEGAEALWEFLRPMLSKGRATKIVTAKDADGNPGQPDDRRGRAGHDRDPDHQEQDG